MEKGIITVIEAAKRLGVDGETIRVGLRNGSFPVGCAVRSPTGRYTYIIPREAFENFMTTGTTPREMDERIAGRVRHLLFEAMASFKAEVTTGRKVAL